MEHSRGRPLHRGCSSCLSPLFRKEILLTRDVVSRECCIMSILRIKREGGRLSRSVNVTKSAVTWMEVNVPIGCRFGSGFPGIPGRVHAYNFNQTAVAMLMCSYPRRVKSSFANETCNSWITNTTDIGRTSLELCLTAVRLLPSRCGPIKHEPCLRSSFC